MSIQAVSWVLDHSEATGGERLVLIAIANHIDFNDPALPVLARESRLSRSAVIRCIQRLERNGELVVERDEHRGRSKKNHYTIPGYERSRFATISGGALSEMVASGAEMVASETGNGRVDATRTISNRVEPGGAPQASPSRRGTRIPDEFVVTDAMAAWASSECPDVDWRLSTKTFVAHWKAESGARATKSNWEMAWRKWLLKDQASAKRGPVRVRL